jgi:CRP-like cAMP-binding protein
MSKSKRAQPRVVLPVVNWTGVQAQRAEYAPGTVIFGQGDPAPSIMYVEKGPVRLSVLSHSGKEAVVAVLDAGHFFGEGCLAGQTQRMATATAMDACTVLIVEKSEMVHQLRARPDFAERFLSHMLTRNIRIERIWSTNSSTPQRSAWHARSCCWHDTVNRRRRTERFPRSRRNSWQKWWGPPDRASTSS